MARQKLPQHKDDCIKCELPSKLGVMSYWPCMNCRNKAVEETDRLKKELAETKDRQEITATAPSNDVSGSDWGLKVDKSKATKTYPLRDSNTTSPLIKPEWCNSRGGCSEHVCVDGACFNDKRKK